MPRNTKATMVVTSPNDEATKNMERHPRYCVSSPPAKGPNASPRYTAEVEKPSTRPLCCGGNADTRIAGPVVLVKAAPIPCINRKMIIHVPDGENPQIS